MMLLDTYKFRQMPRVFRFTDDPYDRLLLKKAVPVKALSLAFRMENIIHVLVFNGVVLL